MLPESADPEDVVDAHLVAITKAIYEARPEEAGQGGLLGGEFGYGANFENDVFMMHRYCWCEEPDCAWCLGCSCDYEPSPSFKVTKQCANCATPSPEAAPNFRHKASGLEVRWYKWIGRDMEIKVPAGVDIRAALGEAVASVRR